jgi:hypothetical protein
MEPPRQRLNRELQGHCDDDGSGRRRHYSCRAKRVREVVGLTGITAHIEGGSAVTPYKQRDAFLTAYIPGLAGLAERETILAQPLLRRQAASGDAGGVLRNVLFNLASVQASDTTPDAGEQRLRRLNEP